MKLTAFITIYDSITLLPDAIAYYQGWGVDKIWLLVCNGKDNPVWESIEKMGMPREVLIARGQDGAEHDADAEASAVNDIRSCNPEGWHIVADLDEFHYFGPHGPAPLAAYCARNGVSHVRTRVVDRIANNLTLPTVHKMGTIYETFPVQCNLTQAIGCNDQKAALVAPGHLISSGHHYCGGSAYHTLYDTHHFKWNAECVERIDRKLRDMKKNPKGWVSEIERMQLRVMTGRLDLSDLPGLWIDATSTDIRPPTFAP